MKTIKVRCQVQGESGWFQVHVGRPVPGFHPLKYQAAWLRDTWQGEIDSEDLKSIEELLERQPTHR